MLLRAKSPLEAGESWEYIDDPIDQVVASGGQRKADAKGDKTSEKEAKKKSKNLSKQRSKEIKKSMPKGSKTWSDYPKEHRRSHTPGQSGDGKPRQRPS